VQNKASKLCFSFFIIIIGFGGNVVDAVVECTLFPAHINVV
jgi:hypothetical protein